MPQNQQFGSEAKVALFARDMMFIDTYTKP
jgi:hypothetical protein